MGDTTWRHLHWIESRSDERRRGYTWREGRRRHSHRTRKHRGLEGAHSHHGLLHGRNLETSQSKLTCCRIQKMPGGIIKQLQREVRGQVKVNSAGRFTCARGGAAAATGTACCSSCCSGSDRPFWVSSSGGSSIFRVLVHSGRNKQSRISLSGRDVEEMISHLCTKRAFFLYLAIRCQHPRSLLLLAPPVETL